MPVKFICSDSNTASVTDLLQGKGPFKLAVAFLGEHSQQILEKTTGKVQILCNLESGATNPFAIETLLKRSEMEIRSNAKLHAKVYWSPAKAIVTSANLSANGLSYEDEELRGWHEAGVVLTDAVIIRQIEQWHHALWKKSGHVTPVLLEAAKEAWRRRRNAVPRMPSTQKKSLFEALRESPGSFKDRRIFFVIWTYDASEHDKKTAKNAAAAGFLGLTENNYDLYVDWDELPDDAQLINFKLDGEKVKYIELSKSFTRADKPYLRGHKSSVITITKKITRIDGAYTLTTDDKKLIRMVGKTLWDKAKTDESARFLSLYEARDVLF